MAATLHYEPLAPWLVGKGLNVWTQFGEDGLIEACLARTGVKHQRCFEFGASDGKLWSNTKQWRDLGWWCLLLESDEPLYEKIQPEHAGVVARRATVTSRNVNDYVVGDYDLGSIDVDGDEYAIWEAMECRPSVMVVEYSPYTQDCLRVPPDVPQATLKPIKELGERKGYTLAATTYCNAIFIR